MWNKVMRKIKEGLVLYDISSTTTDPLAGWKPETLEDTYTSIDLTIGMNDKSKGINYFYVKVATPEALRHGSTGFLISDHRVIVIENFDFKLLKMNIEKILKNAVEALGANRVWFFSVISHGNTKIINQRN
jgi:hypothetical protein